MYNFNAIQKGLVTLPGVHEAKPVLSFLDPELSGYEATVVADTLNRNSERLTTIVARFPRCVLAEMNTHRVFSRNSASSRARSIGTTIREVYNNPYIPLFTTNKPGMSGEFMDGVELHVARESWLKARDNAILSCFELLIGSDLMTEVLYSSHYQEEVNDYLYSTQDLLSNPLPLHADLIDYLIEYYETQVYRGNPNDKGLYEFGGEEYLAVNAHKQNVNRLLEPFMWHEAIITSSFWNNFIELRTNLETAQPEIVAIAKLIEAGLDESVPVKPVDDLPVVHTPFVEPESNNREDIIKAMLLSSAECAQISYKDKSRQQDNANLSLAKRLLEYKHYSPFEHVAVEADGTWVEALRMENRKPSLEEKDFNKGRLLNGNLSEGWWQARHLLDMNLIDWDEVLAE